MEEILVALTEHTDRILLEIVERAKAHGFSKFTSPRVEDWRASIEGLNFSMLTAFSAGADLALDLRWPNNSELVTFGVVEAQKHRARGVTLEMFFKLMKHYRDAYLEVLNQLSLEDEKSIQQVAVWLYHVFDVIETAVISDWSTLTEVEELKELQRKNLLLTNDKNRYLAIFESLPLPIILLDHHLQLENLNLKAAELMTEVVKGYLEAKGKGTTAGNIFASMRRIDYSDLFSYDFVGFIENTSKYNDHFVTRMVYGERSFDYAIEVMKAKDISGRLDGVLVLFTLLKEVILI